MEQHLPLSFLVEDAFVTADHCGEILQDGKGTHMERQLVTSHWKTVFTPDATFRCPSSHAHLAERQQKVSTMKLPLGTNPQSSYELQEL